MSKCNYYGVEVTVQGEMSEAEIRDTVLMLKESNPEKEFKSIEFKVDGEFIDVNYKYDTIPFERIRRITGYLVGTLDRFNDAKRAEVEDRVKHNLGEAVNIEDLQ
jgi:hypothetical protein